MDSCDFLRYKKVGNAHSKLLAYRSYSCIQTTQNGEVDFAQFPMVQKNRNKRKNLLFLSISDIIVNKIDSVKAYLLPLFGS